jgi:hypothetical protein
VMPEPAQLKAALLAHGPMAVAVIATPKFDDYKGGVFVEPNPENPKNVKHNHEVLLVGWDDTRGAHGAWKIKNTWGSKWGEQGFMWIEYGSNNIGINAVWVQAVSMYYSIDQDKFATMVPGSKKLPRPVYVAKNDSKAEAAKTAATTEHKGEAVKAVAATGTASKVTTASHKTNLVATAKE